MYKTSKPKRVLHVVGAMNRAGTETMLMNIYRNIDRNQVQFDFISFSPKSAHYDEEIRRLGGQIIKLNKTFSLKEIFYAIKKNGPYEAIHSHTFFNCGLASFAAKLAGVKVRISHAHTTFSKKDSLKRKLYNYTMKVLINIFSTHLLACSKEAGKYLFGRESLTKSKYMYFPNLIDYSIFMDQHTEQVARFKNEEQLGKSIIIGHIGRFIKAKNHNFLLNVVEELKDRNPTIKLLLVGDGDLRAQIEEEAIIRGIYNNIKFVGLRNDIPVMLQSMDVFVFPSIYEGLGLVLLEAQACGIPCIVSEAIQPEADLNLNLITKLKLDDNAEIWAEKILELIGRKEEDKKRIVQGFDKSGYNLSLGISKLMNIYKL
jgi:glycosyltransferase involved in cell wall biosynthesis